MKKRYLIFTFLLVTLYGTSNVYASVVPNSPCSETKVNDFANSAGKGTQSDPYIISNGCQLQDIKNHTDKHYVLGANIDINTANWDSGQGFEPINNFTGSLNGGGYTISNLTINRPEDINVGLFGTIDSGGVVNEVALTNVNITGDSNVGGLVGLNKGEVGDNSSVTGVVTGGGVSVGGLVGKNMGTIGDNNYSEATVTGGEDSNGYLTGRNIGGFVGSNGSPGVEGRIGSGNYATGDVTGYQVLGGFVGFSYKGTIKDAYAAGDVRGDRVASGYMGGFVGTLQIYETIQNSYAFGNVEGFWHLGAFAGAQSGTVKNSYAYGTVTTTSLYGTPQYVGGFFAIGGSKTESIENTLYQVDINYSGLGIDCNYTKDDRINFIIDTTQPGNNVKYLNNICELQLIYLIPDGNYQLDTDIDAAATANWDSGQGFEPINNFTGSLNGGGYTISNLTINRPATINVGLFGTIDSGGVVNEVALTNVSITGQSNVGGLVGLNKGEVGDNSSVTGAVEGGGVSVGGLVGKNIGTIGDNNYSAARVKGENSNGSETGKHIGGFVGTNGGWAAKGLAAGRIGSGNYATGDVTGLHTLGGFVGINYEGTIENAYAIGDVRAYNLSGNMIGGFAGSNGSAARNSANSIIQNSFAVGNVQGIANVGAFIGFNAGIAQNNYAYGKVAGLPSSSIFYLSSSYNVGGFIANNNGVYASSSGNVYYQFDLNSSDITCNYTKDDRINFIIEVSIQSDNNVKYLNNICELQLINLFLDGNYQLGTDIDASATANWDEGKGFEPINNFTGGFDSGGFTISNLTINRPEDINVGLFGTIDSGGVVNEVALTNVSITGQSNVGGLVGLNKGMVGNTNSVTGIVMGTGSSIGGLVGKNIGVIGNNNYAWVSVKGENSYGGQVAENVGGFVGLNGDQGARGIIGIGNGSLSYVTGLKWVGGFVGDNFDGVIEQSYATGDVRPGGLGGIGGFAGGNNFGSIIKNSFASGNVLAYRNGGAFVGDNSGILEGNYAIGTVSSIYIPPVNVGGFIGINRVTLTGSNIYNYSGSVCSEQEKNSFFAILTANIKNNSATNPIYITTPCQLQLINAAPTLHYRQAANINLTEFCSWNSNGLFNTINYFTGSFDGGGYTISNLTIMHHGMEANGTDSGLFGVLSDDGILSNVKLTNVEIYGLSSTKNVGALVGRMTGGEIRNSSVERGTIRAGSMVGGLVGKMEAGTINDSYARNNVTVIRNSGTSGGLVGQVLENANINRAYASGTVFSRGTYGALIGDNAGTIIDSYASGADRLVGVGYVSGSSLRSLVQLQCPIASSMTCESQTTYTNWGDIWKFGGTDDLPQVRHSEQLVISSINAVGRDKQIEVQWQAPTSNEDSLIGYTVNWESANSGSSSIILDSITNTYIIPNLTNGIPYTVNVVALSSIDVLSSDPIQVAVTLYGVPSIVRNLALTSGNKIMYVVWDKPIDNGGKEITGYELSYESEASEKITVSSIEEEYIIQGLENKVEYTVSVVAINSQGNSLAVTVSEIIFSVCDITVSGSNSDIFVDTIIATVTSGASTCDDITIEDLATITDFTLSGNGITALAEDTFAYFIDLHQLDISNNSLTSLPIEIFSYLPNLSTLAVDASVRLSGIQISGSNTTTPTVLENFTLNSVEVSLEHPLKEGSISVSVHSTTRLEVFPNTLSWTAGSSLAQTLNIISRPAGDAEIYFKYTVGDTTMRTDSFLYQISSTTSHSIAVLSLSANGDDKELDFLSNQFYYVTDIDVTTTQVQINADLADTHADFMIDAPALQAPIIEHSGVTVNIPLSDNSDRTTITLSAFAKSGELQTYKIEINKKGICGRKAVGDDTDVIINGILGLSQQTQCEDITVDSLSNITGYLNLENQGIASIPEVAFAGLTGLERLSLAGNRLTGLPTNIFKDLNRNSFVRLFLHDNQLSSIPEEIFNLKNLTWLTLDGNQLNGFSIDIGLLIALDSLNILDVDDDIRLSGINVSGEMELEINSFMQLDVSFETAIVNKTINVVAQGIGSVVLIPRKLSWKVNGTAIRPLYVLAYGTDIVEVYFEYTIAGTTMRTDSFMYEVIDN